MRIGQQGRIAAIGVSLVMVLGALAAAGLRWETARTPIQIHPPAGASENLPEGQYEAAVDNRTASLFDTLRADSRSPHVDVYAIPPKAPWEDIRAAVADQLGENWVTVLSLDRHEQPADDCHDTGQRTITCDWKEQTRWWPRRVSIALLRPPAPGDQTDTALRWPNNAVLIVGSGY